MSISEENIIIARELTQRQTTGYQSHNIFNMNETALFFTMPSDKGLATKQISRKKGNKDQLTLAFTVNANGLE